MLFVALALLWSSAFFSTNLRSGDSPKGASGPIRMVVQLVGLLALIAFVALFVIGFFFARWWVPLISAAAAVTLVVWAERFIRYQFRPALSVLSALAGCAVTYYWVVGG